MADQRDPLDLDRPGLDQALHQGGQGDAVLAEAQAGVGAQEDRGPALGGERLAVRRAPLLAAAVPEGLVLAEPVQEHHDPAGGVGERRGQPGPSRATSPPWARTAIGIASRGRSRSSRSPIRPLTAE